MTLIVSTNPEVCETELLSGRLFCPFCNGVLRPWGHARPRANRKLDGIKSVRPRRSICADCSKTSVLLPEYLLVRYLDEAEVIGSALIKSAQGIGYRKIALNICFPEATVRGWIRRFREKAEIIRQYFISWALALNVVLSEIEPTGSLFGDAISAIGSAARSASIRFGPKPVWSQISAISAGLRQSSFAVTLGLILRISMNIRVSNLSLNHDFMLLTTWWSRNSWFSI